MGRDQMNALLDAMNSPLDNFIDEQRVDDGVPDPRDVHSSRSQYAQRQDEARDAELTTDPAEYANDPDSFDFPGVDTGPGFESVFGESLSATKFDTIEDRSERGTLNGIFDSEF